MKCTNSYEELVLARFSRLIILSMLCRLIEDMSALNSEHAVPCSCITVINGQYFTAVTFDRFVQLVRVTDIS